MNDVPLQCTVRLNNPNGLHLRPITAFVEMARRFQSSVKVTHDGRSVDGRHPLELMLLGAECGSDLILEVDGPDAPAALDALVKVLKTIPQEI